MLLWPLALPGVAGAILAFILAMNAYGTPVLLGGPQLKMVGPLVFGQFRLNNWPFGATIAFALMTATLVPTAFGQPSHPATLQTRPQRPADMIGSGRHSSRRPAIRRDLSWPIHHRG